MWFVAFIHFGFALFAMTMREKPGKSYREKEKGIESDRERGVKKKERENEINY